MEEMKADAHVLLRASARLRRSGDEAVAAGGPRSVKPQSTILQSHNGSLSHIVEVSTVSDSEVMYERFVYVRTAAF